MRALRRLGAGAAAAGLLLAGCGGGGGDLPSDPQEAVAVAARNAFDGSFTLTFDADFSDDVIAQAEQDDPEAATGLRLLNNEPLSITVDEGTFAFALTVDGNDFVAVRFLGDGLYLKFDAEAAGDLFTEQDLADLQQLRGQIDQLGGAEGPFGPIAGVAQALFDGRWVGIVELPEDAGDTLTNLGGAALAGGVDPDQARQALAQAGLTDPEAFVSNYLDVTGGEDGRYDAELRVRDLLQAVAGLGEQLGQGAVTEEIPDDVPETVGGLVIVTDGDALSAVEVDLARLADAIGEEIEGVDIQEGDAVLRVNVSDSEGVDEPGDAETITWEQLQQLLQLFMGGAAGGLGGSTSG